MKYWYAFGIASVRSSQFASPATMAVMPMTAP
jgi:hypothetical protein